MALQSYVSLFPSFIPSEPNQVIATQSFFKAQTNGDHLSFCIELESYWQDLFVRLVANNLNQIALKDGIVGHMFEYNYERDTAISPINAKATVHLSYDQSTVTYIPARPLVSFHVNLQSAFRLFSSLKVSLEVLLSTCFLCFEAFDSAVCKFPTLVERSLQDLVEDTVLNADR